MFQYALLVDVDRCIGCYTCEIACKQENDVPVGPRWIRVVTVGPQEINGRLRLYFIPMLCMHCSKPPCIDVCPEDAIVKRTDGVVLIDENLCIGCKACVNACAFGALQFNPEKKVVEKCTLCVHRVDKGLKPSCVLNCPTKALYFGDVNDFSEIMRKKQAKNLCREVNQKVFIAFLDKDKIKS